MGVVPIECGTVLLDLRHWPTACSGLATDDPLVVPLLLGAEGLVPPMISVGPAEAAFVTVVDCQPVLTVLRVCESYVRTRTRTVWLPTLKLGGAYRYVPSAPTTSVMSGVSPVPSGAMRNAS